MLSKTFQSTQKLHAAKSGAPHRSVTLTTYSPRPSLSNNHRSQLILLSTEVARKPYPRKIPPPLSVPSNFRNRLKISDLIFIARRLEYGQSSDAQKQMRRFLAPFLPSSCVPAVHVPPHVLGGKTNWAATIDSLLFFFSLPLNLQPEHISSREIRGKQGKILIERFHWQEA